MSRRDFIHVAVREALENDGWQINYDPLIIDLVTEKLKLEIDIGGEKIMRATKNKKEVAIEIKSFGIVSTITAFHTALGQYLNYRDAMEYGNYPQELYLGVSEEGFNKLRESSFIMTQMEKYRFRFGNY